MYTFSFTTLYICNKSVSAPFLTLQVTVHTWHVVEIGPIQLRLPRKISTNDPHYLPSNTNTNVLTIRTANNLLLFVDNSSTNNMSVVTNLAGFCIAGFEFWHQTVLIGGCGIEV